MLEIDQQLKELQDTLSDVAKEIGEKIEDFAKTLDETFSYFDESCVYSEKELKKRIKYSKTPMERKRWQDLLQEKYKNKRRSKK